jgi:sugar lactone lactonase YvrE
LALVTALAAPPALPASDNVPPAFTTQPLSQTLAMGSSVTFTAAATGTPPPTYQWRKDNVDIAGATGASFSIAAFTSGDVGSYTVVATNAAGSVTSKTAALWLNMGGTILPGFVKQPADLSVLVGSVATFTVDAGQAPLSYQWRKDNVNIAGANSATFGISSATLDDAGSYTVVATSPTGFNTSDAATLAVTTVAIAPDFITPPSDQSVIPGSSVFFTVLAGGSPTPALQWRKGGVIINGATNSSFSIGRVAAADAGDYTVVAANSAGSATSQAATLTVLDGRLANATAATGHTATFSAANASGSIQWQVSSNGGSIWRNVVNDGNYSGATTSTLTVANVTSAMNGLQYEFVATDHGTVSRSPAAILSVAAPLLPFPTSLMVDSSGNLYVGDGNANTVQKISTVNQVSAVAGNSGTSGSADGTGSAARFAGPNGMVLLANGNLVVVDTANSTLRTVTPAGVVSTLAGMAGIRGNVDGNGTAASFSSPAAVARTSSGVLFVADSMNHTIRKVTSDGAVTTFAGGAGVSGWVDGTGDAARFNLPSGIAVDANGNVFVADTTNNLIRKITPAGGVTTLAGTAGVAGFDDGVGGAALFNRPEGLAIDAGGNLYVADTGNSVIRKVSAGGTVSTFAGLPTVAGLEDGVGTFALLNQPRSLALDSAGNLYVADTGNAAIRKIDPGGNVTTLALSAAPESAPAPTPTPTPTPTPSPSSSGGGGGGGSIEPWFLAALVLLGFAVSSPNICPVFRRSCPGDQLKR